MSEKNFSKLLNDLYDGKIEKFELLPEEFNDFYIVWENFRFQQSIRGIAGENGKITYIKKS